MALSALTVYNKFAYLTMQETLQQQVGLFNAATKGGLVLRTASNLGDFSDETMWKRVTGLVRRRNSYGSGAVAEKELQMLNNTTVKVAAGTPPVRIDPGQFKWILKNPEEAGVLLGRQLAEDTMQDELNIAIGVYVAAIGQVAGLVSANTGAVNNLSNLVKGAALFGDRSQDIKCWLMHSKVRFDIYQEALANTAKLFSFGNIRVEEDGFGRPMIITDSPNLLTVDGVGAGIDKYYSLGLTTGAVTVELNDDFTSNVETKNGDENLIRTWQAEWSYNLGLKGFTWDKTNGGKSPTTAALLTATNWDKTATGNKDCAGVMVTSR